MPLLGFLQEGAALPAVTEAELLAVGLPACRELASGYSQSTPAVGNLAETGLIKGSFAGVAW